MHAGRAALFFFVFFFTRRRLVGWVARFPFSVLRGVRVESSFGATDTTEKLCRCAPVW